jgi:phage-related protein
MREVIFYRTGTEASPVVDFFDSLSGKQSQKVLWVLRLIEELDIVPGQYLKKLINTDDIWEVRVQVGNNTFRLLGFFVENNLLILTNGFTKKTQKTPSQEINLAQQRKRDYLNRRLKNE